MKQSNTKALNNSTFLGLLLFIFLINITAIPTLNAKTQAKRGKGHGTYDEQLNRQFPYTFITGNLITSNYISELKTGLLQNQKEKFLLRFIYERYNENYSSFNKETTYKKSLRAKLAAFIYMVGVKYNSTSNQVESLPAFGNQDREIYGDIAKNILSEIDIKPNYFNGVDRQRKRAFELLNYLQAYDYLMTAKTVLQNGSLSNESDIKDKLLDFTFELHAAANNINQSYVRNNNISLIVASAVGTSAVIFSQEGAGWLQVQRQPERWAHAAHGYIARTLFEGNSWSNFRTEGPMLNKDDVTFYGEGSHYFTYAWQCLLVFMKTYYKAKGINSLTDGSDPGGRAYNPCLLCSKVSSEPYNSKNYQYLYKGYIESLDLNGWHPSVDDTWIPDRRFAPLLVLGDNRFNPYLTNFDKIPDFDKSKLDFIGYGDGQQSFEADVLLTKFTNNFGGLPHISNYLKAGYIALRDSNLYINLNCERDNMLEGGYHEHGDVGSFEIRVGKEQLVQMVYDPPYFGEDSRDWIKNGFQHNCILVDGDGPHKNDGAVTSSKEINLIQNPDGSSSGFTTMAVKYNYWNHLSQVNMKTAITRKMNVYNDYSPYIIIEDNVLNNSLLANDISFRMNGNGLEDNSSFYFRENNEAAIWDKPCSLTSPENNYRMRLRSVLLNADGSEKKKLSFTEEWQKAGGSTTAISGVTTTSTELKSDKTMKLVSTIEFIPCNDTAGQITKNVITNQSLFFRAKPKFDFTSVALFLV